MLMDKREVEGSCGFMDALSCDPKEACFFGGNEEKACSSTCSSSIGENSDTKSQGSMDDYEEVESPFTSIQIRKGMSRFYNGKSKSFTSLREASTSSSLAKAESGNKKRRNILACRLPNYKKSHTAISKTLAVAMNSGCNGSFSGWRSFSLADLQFTTPPPSLEKKPTN